MGMGEYYLCCSKESLCGWQQHPASARVGYIPLPRPHTAIPMASISRMLTHEAG